MTRRLLAVDWDYFFPNPKEAPALDTGHEVQGLFGWGHFESPFMVNTIWPIRASDFINRGLDLPTVSGWERFWDRFTLPASRPFVVTDSNAFAGRVVPSTLGSRGERWNEVWLFDAHHDSGYHGTYDQWLADGSFSCEDWMLAHHQRGASLHVRYPAWKASGISAEPEPLVPVDRAVDTGDNCPTRFHGIAICRSGAWVPSWADEQFERFVADCPGRPVYLQNMARHFDRTRAEEIARAQRDALARMRRDA